MKPTHKKIEIIISSLKKELNNPKLNEVRKEYLNEKIRMIRVFILGSEK